MSYKNLSIGDVLDSGNEPNLDTWTSPTFPLVPIADCLIFQAKASAATFVGAHTRIEFRATGWVDESHGAWIRQPDWGWLGRVAFPESSAETNPTMVLLLPVPGGPCIRHTLCWHEPVNTFQRVITIYDDGREMILTCVSTCGLQSQ